MISSKAINGQQFDAIVIGSGISGGWAAKELTEKGLKVLLLERGMHVEHGADYPGEGKAPWEFPLRGEVTKEQRERQPIQSKLYAYEDATKQFFVDDIDSPYVTPEDKPFVWHRGYHTGGKSILWGRWTFRWSDYDFEANSKDGYGIDWPIRYRDIAPWYDHVERFAGISGSMEGLPQLPDGVFQKPFEMTCLEKMAKQGIETSFPDRKMIIGRCAHLTEPTEEQMDLGRGPCQARNECPRGCSFGAYFSSQSATLPAAERTGNLHRINNAIVESLDYDAKRQKVSAVKVLDAVSGDRAEYSARVVFLCASTLASTQILLQSSSEAFPKGFANKSGVLGHYLMDHTLGFGASGVYHGLQDKFYKGRRPTGIYVPRYRNITKPDKRFLRGYAYQGDSHREAWWRGGYTAGVGAELKQKLRQPGSWRMSLIGFGEILPNYENQVSLHPTKKDKWGMPALNIDAGFGPNEKAQIVAMQEDAVAMLKAAGLTDVEGFDWGRVFGEGIHEMGTARMGEDPTRSVLNKWNQAHDAQNLFVTDGSCMASSACQNPSLTYMALTARAANHAAERLKEGSL